MSHLLVSMHMALITFPFLCHAEEPAAKGKQTKPISAAPRDLSPARLDCENWRAESERWREEFCSLRRERNTELERARLGKQLALALSLALLLFIGWLLF